MEANHLHSQWDALFGLDTTLPELPSTAEEHEEEEVIDDRIVLSKDERVSTTQAATRKRKAPVSAGRRPSTAKRLRTRNSTSASPTPASRARGSQLPRSKSSAERTQQWIDAITPREGSDNDERISDNDELTSSNEKWLAELLEKQSSLINRSREVSGDLDLMRKNRRELIISVVVLVTAWLHLRLHTVDDRLVNNLKTIAAQLSKDPASDAVKKASKDLQARYGGKEGQPGQYSDEIVGYCLAMFVQSPRRALLWTGLGEQAQAKDAQMARWAQEFDELLSGL
ncbi:hypothetical protein DHEL01_v203339 [Diaporthe helianthi]|uniref:Uncharacterized protein n=1 Tax=Diaporthe helianthi TaxID=158607 RepID=A0A2P5I6Z1_DIAHE|nr:hypothetical protein DHEL01_v203339 [Diaporthe helianthi]